MIIYLYPSTAGKCLPPVTSRRNPLLRTAYGISPDRNLRDRQVSRHIDIRLFSAIVASRTLHCIVLIVCFAKIFCDKYFDTSCFLGCSLFPHYILSKTTISIENEKQGVDTQICPAPVRGPHQSYSLGIDNVLDILSLLTKFYHLSCIYLLTLQHEWMMKVTKDVDNR